MKAQSKYAYGRKYFYPYILQIGAGGTGGYLVQHIAQMLSTSKVEATYIIADPDTIENKNLGNQLFLPEEVGLKKADVLASRYSEAYGIEIASYSDAYIETVQQLKALTNPYYLNMTTPSYNTLLLPIIIGAVDNNFTRQIIHEFFQNIKQGIYIDAGNESTVCPSDWQTRSKSEWTDKELEEFNESGWSGQVVTGVKLNAFEQDPLAVVFPDILTDEDEVRPSDMSCTELTASEPQRLIVNKFAALAIMSSLSQIVEEQTISTHITYFHAKRGYMNSSPIQQKESHTV